MIILRIVKMSGDDVSIDLLTGLVGIVFGFLFLLRMWRLKEDCSKIVAGYHCYWTLVRFPKPLGFDPGKNLTWNRRKTIGALLILAQLSELVTDVLQRYPYHRLLAASTFLIAIAFLWPLLYLEHQRSIRPADLAVVFLLTSLVADAVLLFNKPTEAWLLPSTKVILKLLLVATESQGKQAVLVQPYSEQPPEQHAGILNRAFFWWINPILAQGYQKVLNIDALPGLDDQLSSQHIRRHALKAWDQRARPTKKTALPRALAKTVLPHFITPIIPRLFLIFFRYAQPVLISAAVRMLNGQSQYDSNVIIIGAAFVYVGLAVGYYSKMLSDIKH